MAYEAEIQALKAEMSEEGYKHSMLMSKLLAKSKDQSGRLVKRAKHQLEVHAALLGLIEAMEQGDEAKVDAASDKANALMDEALSGEVMYSCS